MPLTGTDAIPRVIYANPYDPGTERTTLTVEFDDSAGFTTFLGPVPQGRVYRVYDIDLENASSGTLVFNMRMAKDNGSGGKMGFPLVSVFTLRNVRMPLTKHLNPATGLFLTPILTMEFDDILQVKSTTAPATTDPNIRASYWDIPA